MDTLKVGGKVQLLRDVDGFVKGQVVEAFRIEKDGTHLFKGANTRHNHCDGQEGAWVYPSDYRVLPSTVAHPHADLMLKYAMIAQYDDKPWECFEYLASDGTWVTKNESSPFRRDAQYQLKPQPSVVQVGQTWISPEGITVQVQAVLSGSSTVEFNYLVGGVNQVQCMNSNVFSKVFKRKE